MAEAIISPGVFFNENDNSGIPQNPVTVGAALVGPTVKGPVNIPTVVTSYTDYTTKFGSIFTTGSSTEEYFTSLAVHSYFQQGGQTLIVTRVVSGSTSSVPNGGYTPATASVTASGVAATSFELETIGAGVIMNNLPSGSITNGYLPSGSVNNIRWEIPFSDTGSGYFTLVIRRGDDNTNNKTVLETWSNLSLDPNKPNYIEYVIGNVTYNPVQDEFGNWQLQMTGSYANKSRYVRVKNVAAQPNYLGFNGTVDATKAIYMPAAGSGSLQGSFGGAVGELYGGSDLKLFERITRTAESAASAANNIQGLIPSNYDVAISLLKNKDWYDYETFYAPGLTLENAADTLADIIDMVELRGDAVAVIDPIGYGATTSTTVAAVVNTDTSYGAAYWPWVMIRSNETGKVRNVPASLVIPGAYEFSEAISAPWWAPAGLTRGGLTTVLGPEQRLSRTQRDTLYNGKVNPIAIFPGEGTVIYGQKTLQTAQTALKNLNVRKLLIALKQEIGAISERLVFDQNTVATRTKFINQVTPYLQSVQQQSGLYAFRVQMDESLNTPDVIDRGELRGLIYVQPTRTAEFVIIDFNITSTGATFGQ